MSIDYFKELISSNTNINETVDGFTQKLLLIQKEIQTMEAMKNI
jgi:hypothetical protein